MYRARILLSPQDRCLFDCLFCSRRLFAHRDSTRVFIAGDVCAALFSFAIILVRFYLFADDSSLFFYFVLSSIYFLSNLCPTAAVVSAAQHDPTQYRRIALLAAYKGIPSTVLTGFGAYELSAPSGTNDDLNNAAWLILSIFEIVAAILLLNYYVDRKLVMIYRRLLRQARNSILDDVCESVAIPKIIFSG